MSELNDFIFSNRSDFSRGALDETTITKNPAVLFERWLKDAIESNNPEPYSFTLITNDSDGFPNGRVVYLRTLEADGSFVFFTNYNSAKGQSLELNQKVAVVFFWSTLERQVRMKANVEKLDPLASDIYFDSRPEESKLGAWASAQSSSLNSREDLLKQIEFYRRKFANQQIPRPEHWGGYLVKPVYYEFWQGRSSRLHDRFEYKLKGELWSSNRLSP